MNKAGQPRAADGRFINPYVVNAPIERGEGLLTILSNSVWRDLLEQANEAVVVKIDGRRTKRTTRLEACLLELGSGPCKHNKLMRFISLVRLASSMLEREKSATRHAALVKADIDEIARSFKQESKADWKGAITRLAERHFNAAPDRALIEAVRTRVKRAKST